MNTEKIKLTGLRPEDYIHPDEQKMKLESNSALISEALDKLSDLSVFLNNRMTLGRDIEITKEISPEVYTVLEDVCAVLDYPQIPHLFVCHEASQAMFCVGAGRMQMIVSDYLLTHFDTDMLYYAFGNLVAMFKSGHARLSTVCSVMFGTPDTLVFEIPLKAYLRAADMSSDRAGLLACQNFSAAAKCILWDAGISVREMENIAETEIIELSENYIHTVESISKDSLTALSAGWKKMATENMPPAYKLKELLNWYRDGSYTRLLGRWKKGGEF